MATSLPMTCYAALLAGELYRTEKRELYLNTAGAPLHMSLTIPPSPKELEAELPRLIAEFTAVAHTGRYRIALRPKRVLGTEKVPWEHCPHVMVDRPCIKTVYEPVIVRDGAPVPAVPLVFTYNDDLDISAADVYTYALIKERIALYSGSYTGGGYLMREAHWLGDLREQEALFRQKIVRKASEGAYRRRRAALATWGRVK